MLKFLGIIIEIGLVQMPKVDYYWTKSHWRCNVKRQICIVKCLHFWDNEEQNASQDRLTKLTPLLILLKARFKSVYMAGSVITVEEKRVMRQQSEQKLSDLIVKIAKAEQITHYV
jgi:hypothetical protein